MEEQRWRGRREFLDLAHAEQARLNLRLNQQSRGEQGSRTCASTDSSARQVTALANLDQVWGSLHVFLTFFLLVNFVLMQTL